MAASLYRNTWHRQVKEFLIVYHAETVDREKLQDRRDRPGGHYPRVSTYIDSESSNAEAPSLGSLTQVYFAASVFSLALKTKEHPHGVYTEQAMYMALAVIFTCNFSEIDPAKSFPLRLAANALIGATLRMPIEFGLSIFATICHTRRTHKQPSKNCGVFS